MANNDRFTKIESFKELKAAKMRLYYEKKILKHKIEIRRMEMSMLMNPANIASVLFSGLANNIISRAKSFFNKLFYSQI